MSIVRRLSKTKSKKVLLFTRYYPARRFGMNMPKSRNIVQPLQIRPLSLLFFGKKSIL